MSLISALNVMQQGPQFCVGLLPLSEFASLYSALICGINLPAGEAKRLFLDTGLIHLMVVSGAHLLFLERRLRHTPVFIRMVCLILYCWLTGFGAPVVKALLRRIFEICLRNERWSGLQCEALAVVTALLITPSWLLSRSFLMSWICTLAFITPPVFPRMDSPIKAYLLIFAFCAPSPLTLLWNIGFAPLVGEVLFPLCLLVIPLPFLTPLVDLVWTGLFEILKLGPHADAQTWFAPSDQLFWLPLILHSLFLFWEVQWRRRSAFLPYSS